jgi:hypothetical protein
MQAEPRYEVTPASLEEHTEVFVEEDVGVEHDRALLTFHAPFTVHSKSSR